MTMDMRLQPLERAKTYELVVRQIKGEIYAGRLRPGDRLPGERQMSEQLQVSRPSVREAIRILEAMEIVKSRPGNGAGSGLIVSTEPSRALSDLIGIHVALSSYSLAEVVGVRMALEVQTVRRIAANIDAADLTQLYDTLHRMDAPDIDRATFIELDTEFHVGLARCADNTLLADLMVAMREAVRRPMTVAFDDDLTWSERVEMVRREHLVILEAISTGDATKAEAAMRNHIEVFYEDLQSATGD